MVADLVPERISWTVEESALFFFCPWEEKVPPETLRSTPGADIDAAPTASVRKLSHGQ